MAAGGRVRVARDRKSYRRCWERDLDPARRPELPAAVRTYDKAGQTRCAAFDLDARKGATRAAVLRDSERLAGWLDAAGCSYAVDESGSGGRHVYVFLDQPLSWADLAPLARRLRASKALPTLDPGPMANPTEGCIRPPGAAHRDGGHQRLVTPLAQAAAAAARRTSPACWAAFLDGLPEAPPDRIAIDLGEPARAPAEAGAAAPLAPAYAAIAATGRYDAGRYPSPSEARAAVLMHALCRGWDAARISAHVAAGGWPGLALLYRGHYGPGYAGKALAGDLARAEARARESPLHRIHTSAPRPRGAGGGAAVRGQLRRWTAALGMELARGRWPTARSYGIELVLLALGDAARRSQSVYPAFGVRHLSMGAGTCLEPSAVAKILRLLAAEPDPLLLLVEPASGVEADTYELRVPDGCLARMPADADLPQPPVGVHPAFSLLPRPAYRLYAALRAAPGPASAADLAAAARMPVRTVHATLNALREAKLARSRGGAWAPGRRSLARLARLGGIPGRLRGLVDRWRAERESLRAAHGLPPRPRPPRSAIAWPGSPAPARPPEPPPDPPPGWAAELDAAVAEILRVFDATPIPAGAR